MTKKASTNFIAFLLGSTLLLFFSCEKKQPESLRIATAANMQFVMEELTAKFTEVSDISCVSVISSSGKLTAQIREGAPFDVFVSADLKYPESLYAAGFTTDAPQVYAYGQLVLWTKKTDMQPALATLTSATVRHIALANPKTAPYGRAAQQVIDGLEASDILYPKLVFGESIAQTNQFIISQAAEIGFTAQSVVAAPHLNNQGQWRVIAPEAYDPISQGVVVLRGDTRKETEGQAFVDFLQSATGQEILANYGYLATDTSLLQ